MRISQRLRLYGMKLYDLPRHKAARLLIAMWKSNADPTLPRTRLAHPRRRRRPRRADRAE